MSFSSSSSDDDIFAFSDSDWAAYPDTHRSITSFNIYSWGFLISWQTKKQKVDSHSSTEVEYRALASTSYKFTWLMSLLFKLCNPAIGPSMCQPCIYIDNTHLLHATMYNTWIGHLFGTREVLSSLISLHHIDSWEDVIDIFIKPLPKTSFIHLLPKLHLMDPYLPMIDTSFFSQSNNANSLLQKPKSNLREGNKGHHNHNRPGPATRSATVLPTKIFNLYTIVIFQLLQLKRILG